ncbi:MAG: hypothetical protein L3J57_15060, partial [Desulfuromusa sp.]|nr:hypothetical protein [Desulfuromusa sp.]
RDRIYGSNPVPVIIDKKTLQLRGRPYTGLSPAPSGAVPRVYDPRRTTLVRTAKAWDSPHAGTVPFLLETSLY